ncbi:MAG TPA: rhodanese-like domain-containing protein [Methylomirabilota bacterium]|nr:rhodanese-like domain-containing protein [Methylomirabilota bacterium]
MAQHTLKDSERGQAAISHPELRARLRDQRLVIVDVMPRETYADGHIPGAINVPVAEIETEARRLIPNLWQEIAVYCAGPT